MIETKLNSILQEQAVFKLIYNRMLSKMEMIEVNLQIRSQHVNAVQIDPQFLLIFPIKNADELLSIEYSLKNEIDFVQKLVSIAFLVNSLKINLNK